MKRPTSAIVAVVSLTVAGTTLAQMPEITSFPGNGQLTWTNSDTNRYCRIEWAPSLTAPVAWLSDYAALIDGRDGRYATRFLGAVGS